MTIAGMGLALFVGRNENARVTNQLWEERSKNSEFKRMESLFEQSQFTSALIGKLAATGGHPEFFRFLDEHRVYSISCEEKESDVHSYPKLGVVQLILWRPKSQDGAIAKLVGAHLLFDKDSKQPIDIIYHEGVGSIWKIENVSKWSHLGKSVACYRITPDGFVPINKDYVSRPNREQNDSG